MLITTTIHDIPSKLDANGRPIRIFVIAPTVPGYPNAKFPGIYNDLDKIYNCWLIVSLGVVCFRLIPKPIYIAYRG